MKPFEVVDQFEDKLRCDESATRKGRLFMCIEAPDGYAEVELTREQATRLRDWIEHEFLDKV